MKWHTLRVQDTGHSSVKPAWGTCSTGWTDSYWAGFFNPFSAMMSL